jgi:Nuclease A inhibitor-like protein
MQPKTEQLFITLKSLVQKLSSGEKGIGSEGDYRFSPLIWDVSKQGQFSFVNLLQFSGLLITIEVDELIEIWQDRCQPSWQPQSQSLKQALIAQALSLIEKLRSHLTDLQAYKIQTYSGHLIKPLSIVWKSMIYVD